jgi:hypothetical protein
MIVALKYDDVNRSAHWNSAALATIGAAHVGFKIFCQTTDYPWYRATLLEPSDCSSHQTNCSAANAITIVRPYSQLRSPADCISKLEDINKEYNPTGRYEAVINAPDLFTVERLPSG